jgi:DNA excision repair protein ERCC-5
MDPYRLPEASMPTVSTDDKPDARLATEAELKQFIDEVHPEDIDIESPEFRALPTEVQYEIVGDMRVRSRQTSHKRLADMLRAAPSALDFSMAQIKNLSQRNALTQQLLTVTDMVGQAHLTIPVRIAAERNREYVLVKRDETQGGGWALGIREGSKQKPIEVVDHDTKPQRSRDLDSDSDLDSDFDESDIEEIAPPPPVSRQTTDPDLKEHRRREVLEAIASRYAPKKAPKAPLDIEPKAFGKARVPGTMPLFDATDEDLDDDVAEVVPSANDEALALALQQEELGSDEEEADLELARALALSRREAEFESELAKEAEFTRAKSVESVKSETSEDSFEEVSLAPSMVPTPQVLSQQPTPIEIDVVSDEDEDMVEIEGPLAPFTLPSAKPNPKPTNLCISEESNNKQVKTPHDIVLEKSKSVASPHPTKASIPVDSKETHHLVSSNADLKEVDRKLEEEVSNSSKPVVPPTRETTTTSSIIKPSTAIKEDPIEDDFIEILPDPVKPISEPRPKPRPQSTAGSGSDLKAQPQPQQTISARDARPAVPPAPASLSVEPPARPGLHRSLSRLSHRASPAVSRASSTRSVSRTPGPQAEPDDPDNLTNSLLGIQATRPVDRHSYMEMAEESVPSSHQGSIHDENGESDDDDEDKEEDEDQIEWSKSPSPTMRRPPLQPAQSGESDIVPSEVEFDGDEGEMAPAEMVAEQDDYARFMASIRNRDLNEVRTEIDDEIRVLNSQNKVAMRDSDEITQAMVAQIQVS